MVTRKEEEINRIKEGLKRTKLPTYEQIFEDNDERDVKGKSKSNENEEINSFRYPAIILIGDTGK
jgi:hypothetical protein